MNMGNLFIRAARLCGTSPAVWWPCTGNSLTSIGTRVSQYGASVPVQVSAQPVARTLMQFLGLDASKEYLMIYAAVFLNDLDRDFAGDLIDFAGDRYQIMSNTEWKPVNGWNGSLAVRIGPVPVLSPLVSKQVEFVAVVPA